MSAVRTTVLFDIGDPAAAFGSPAWCRAARESLSRLKQQTQDAVSSLKYQLLAFAKDRHFAKLADRSGEPFMSWEDFVRYPEPYGLGMRIEIVRAVMSEQNDARLLRDVIEAVPPLAKHGEIGRGRNRVDNVNSKRSGNSAAYLIAKLKRDAPEFADRLAAGEYRSARAAARAASIVKPPPSWPDKLRTAWRRCTPEERDSFKQEIAC